MTPPTVAPCGTWTSPISAERLAAGAKPLAEPRLDGSDIVWLEGRAAEGGRVVVCRRAADGSTRTLTPAPFNVRTRVHEYGGGAMLAVGGELFFSNFADNLVYRQLGAAAPVALTQDSRLRHADFELDAARRRLIAVCEDHRDASREAANTLATIALDGGAVAAPLASGFDFYASPRLSPDGRELAWLCWNHPQMPWNGCELWRAEVAADGTLQGVHRVAGGPAESMCQPQWSPEGRLFVVSDRSGWWNLVRVDGEALQVVCPMAAEFGQPAWVFGQSMFGFEDERTVIAACIENGVGRLLRIDLASGRAQTIPTPFTSLEGLRVGPGFALAVAGAVKSLLRGG